jgi:DNA-binding transcriptional MerR regulator
MSTAGRTWGSSLQIAEMETLVGQDAAGIYSIGAVARMLGLSVQTLRAWEDRYEQVVPARSSGGRRLYSRDQVDQLSFVREQIARGLQPSDAHRLLAQRTHEVAQTRVPPGPRVGVDSEGGRLAVLLAERDPYAAEFADYFLRTEGYAVHVVLSAAGAEQILDAQPLNVAVVDLMISGGAGLTLCRTIRARTSIPILAVSAVDSRDEALDAGVDAFLHKPVEPLRLISTVRDLIGTSAYLRRGGQLR